MTQDNLTSPVFVNEAGGILAMQESGIEIYIRPETELHERAMAGEFGEIDEFIPPLAPTQEELLTAERATMVCSRLQGRLVLGEETCNALDTIANDVLTPWAMRQTIQNAIEWRRTSQAMTELGYLLGYTDEQMDDLFRLAMTVDV